MECLRDINLLKGTIKGLLTPVTPRSTKRREHMMMMPTRERLICFDRDGTSKCGFPGSSPVAENGRRENSHASVCATISPYDADEGLEVDPEGERILKADWIDVTKVSSQEKTTHATHSADAINCPRPCDGFTHERFCILCRHSVVLESSNAEAHLRFKSMKANNFFLN